MTDILLEIVYNQDIKLIKKYLEDKKIELGENDKQNRILFIDHVLTNNKDKIKKRSKIRRKLSKLY
jgi:hypothetical protein